ncbi:MAG TPA: hypothetical protein VGR12_04560 [Solirubrobacteraceae bacterium]|nr:hypothetical protein [Solirubrobacteraceae bacterium]
MLRQRIRIDRTTAVMIGQLVTLLVALAVLWYGLVLGLLATGALDAGTAAAVTGYRAAYDSLAGIPADEVDGIVRLFTGLGGLLAFLLFGWLALKQVPRPRLARGELVLVQDDRGEVTLAPRAFERAVESAAIRHAAVTGARGRYGGREVSVDIEVSRPTEVPDTLREVQRHVHGALRRSELPDVPVHVTVTGFDAERRLT